MTRLELKNLREKYGYAIRTVAKEMGLSHSYLQQMENGSKIFTSEYKALMLNALYKLNEKEVSSK